MKKVSWVTLGLRLPKQRESMGRESHGLMWESKILAHCLGYREKKLWFPTCHASTAIFSIPGSCKEGSKPPYIVPTLRPGSKRIKLVGQSQAGIFGYILNWFQTKLLEKLWSNSSHVLIIKNGHILSFWFFFGKGWWDGCQASVCWASMRTWDWISQIHMII